VLEDENMMGRVGRAPSKVVRWGLLGAAFVVVFASFTDDAEARYRRKRVRLGGYSPPYAAIVVDANSGQTLHAANADSLRHPASITKIMTLYLLFEQLEAGKLKLTSELPVSAHAASQAPSKLGVRPGQTIEVEDAIKALVTKSANDVAVVIAEAIGGDEDTFAEMMTRKARAIGMSRTVYANASGLPNPDQVTTARDQAVLGRAVQDRFPRLYRYFSTPVFYYHGRAIGNHNRLLGRVRGVDGIKTGFIRASGFNLVSSMRRDDRHIVAVVMGGSSGRSRDARMRELLEGHIMEASVRRTAPRLVEVADATNSAPVLREAPPPPVRNEAPQKPMLLHAAQNPGSAEPIKPIMVKTVAVKRTAQAVPAAEASATESHKPAINVAAQARQQVASAVDMPVQVNESRPSRRAVARGEWVIQIGAFPEEAKAHDRLREAQSLAKTMLTSAEPFTQRVVKGDATLYRARFAGFDRDSAEAACQYFKRNEIACLALKN
jgi:D-alanyl-D-alanine carboxypeptidase